MGKKEKSSRYNKSCTSTINEEEFLHYAQRLHVHALSLNMPLSARDRKENRGIPPEGHAISESYGGKNVVSLLKR